MPHSHFAKRHTAAIAAVMQATCPCAMVDCTCASPAPACEQWFSIRNALVTCFASDNDRFDISSFEIACLPLPEKVTP